MQKLVALVATAVVLHACPLVMVDVKNSRGVWPDLFFPFPIQTEDKFTFYLFSNVFCHSFGRMLFAV